MSVSKKKPQYVRDKNIIPWKKLEQFSFTCHDASKQSLFAWNNLSSQTETNVKSDKVFTYG